MKKTIAAIAITLALAVTAVAQNESQHCYRRDGYNVCEFQPSGRVSVSWGDEDDYHSLWYTAKTWPAAHAQLKKIWERDDAEVQAFLCSLQRQHPNFHMGGCPPSTAKDTMEECLKNYKKQPWSAPGIAKNAQAQCTEEIRKAEEAEAQVNHPNCWIKARDIPFGEHGEEQQKAIHACNSAPVEETPFDRCMKKAKQLPSSEEVTAEIACMKAVYDENSAKTAK